jgi:hypothetical protein
VKKELDKLARKLSLELHGCRYEDLSEEDQERVRRQALEIKNREMRKPNGKIIIIREVRGDWPIGHNTIAEPGVYDAYVNPHGAVSVMASNGRMLGIKPCEFEWLEKPSYINKEGSGDEE